VFTQGAPWKYVICVLVLTTADALAALVGSRWGRLRYEVDHNSKSVEGSAVFLVATFLAVLIPLLLWPTPIDPLKQSTPLVTCLLTALLIAVPTTGLEAISQHGRDNLWVPLGALLILNNTLHLPVALAAARAGCHLFIEKPIAESLDGIDELIDLVEQKHLAAFVAYQFRFHPGLSLIKTMIADRKLGHLTGAHIVNGEYLPGWHPYEDYRETHPARRELGGGCLRIQTHELDYALWLFGMPRQVFAVGGQLSRLEVNVEDAVDILMQCQDDGRPLPVHIRLDYLQRPPQRVCEVIGDEGKVLYNYYLDQVEFYHTESRRVETYKFAGFDRNQMFIDEIRHFLDCVRGDATPLVDLREGLRSMTIGLAADESLRTGKAVEVAL